MVSEKWKVLRRFWPGTMWVVLLGLGLAMLLYWLKWAPVKVVQHRIERGPIVAEVLGTGTLEAHVMATVSSKIEGRISHVLVDQGHWVTEGQLLVRLDEEELKQQFASVQADWESTKESLDRLNADRGMAKAIWVQAKKTHERVKTLLEKNLVSQDEWDKAIEALAVAQAGLSRAEAAIMEGRKKLLAAEKTRNYRRATLSETRVTAPFDGLIVRRHRDPGDVVVPGSPILTLISPDELWISAWVDETEMAKLQEGQPARVVFRSEPDRSYPGTVVRLGREADRETREFIVDVRVKELPKNWAVGHRAEVYIETTRKEDVIVLPATYVIWQEGNSGVWVNRDGYTEWRVVDIGLRNPDMIEITNGLQPGELVVMSADPGRTLKDGQRITR
ncbi:MAG: efflux RND transporter periplasmic adaptor subunit [Nitrospirales bacterium]